MTLKYTLEVSISMTRLHRLWVFAAGTCALLAVPLLDTTVASAAVVGRTLNVESTDSQARGTFTITWNSRTSYSVKWKNADLPPGDGAGAILKVHHQANDFADPYLDVYDHVLDGAGNSNSGTGKQQGPTTAIKFVALTECNGGSQGLSKACNTQLVQNPYF